MTFIAPHSKSIRMSVGNLLSDKFDMAMINFLYVASVLLGKSTNIHRKILPLSYS